MAEYRIFYWERNKYNTIVLQKGYGVMAKKAIQHVWMDADLKVKAEVLYRDMETSFVENIWIFMVV